MSPMSSGRGRIPGADEIAEALTEHGQFVTTVDRRAVQQLVDLHWAAHQAGRMIGSNVRVLVERLDSPREFNVTIVLRPSGR